MWNPKVINTDHTLYIAIADAIERDINLNILKAHEKMPTQRSLAELIGVNLTTITRAYKEAERRGLIYGTVGRGTFVASQNPLHHSLPAPDYKKEYIEFGLIGSLSQYDPDLSSLLSQIASDDSKPYLKSLLDYNPSQGLPEHREVASEWIKQFGVVVDPDHMVITAGAMNAINCCLLGLFEPGDRIAVDQLTYTGFKSAAQLHRIKLEAIPMDAEGMLPESLDALCQKGGIKGIYLMPNLQNPTATSMSEERKDALAELILEHNLILIEDDIYNFTNLNNTTAITTRVPDHGIYICGISKSFYPGLRIAFTALPDRFLFSYTQALASSLLMTSPLNAELVCAFIRSGGAEKIVALKKNIIAKRLAITLDYLKDFQVSYTLNSPFVWLTLPEHWAGRDFEVAALTQGIRVLSSEKFHVGSTQKPNAIRLSFGAIREEEDLIIGLERLVKLMVNTHHLKCDLTHA